MSGNYSAGYSARETLARVYLADIICQSNSIEALLDDALAKDHFDCINKSYSEGEYLDYIKKKLLKLSLAKKCKMLQAILAKHANLQQIDYNTINRLFFEWKEKRNIAAHGYIVNNSRGIPILYWNGTCYSINKLMNCFLELNASVIQFISNPELHSPYNGKCVLREPNNNPDSLK